MKMAKASPEEIEAGIRIVGILDSIDSGYYPLAAGVDEDDEAPTFFDEDDPAHLRHFYDQVKATLDSAPGWPGRVIFGFAVIADPRNKMLDPNADTLEFHPAIKAALDAKDAWRPVMEAVARELSRKWAPGAGNAPGHGHEIPGVWNSDNGALAGKECAWCAAWNTAVRMLDATGAINEADDAPIQT